MSTFESTSEQLADANVEAAPSEPTTEQRQTAISEVNDAQQTSETTLATEVSPENTTTSVKVNNEPPVQPLLSTINPGVPAANAAQPVPLGQDSQQPVHESSNINPNMATGQAAVEEAHSSMAAPPTDEPTSPTFEAAQESVMQSMASDSKDRASSIQSNRGRGRGRPRTSNLPNGDRTLVTESSATSPNEQSLTTPVRRGRGGRPRVRGSARSKGKSSRKRRGDAAGDMTDSDEYSDEDDQHAKDPIVTKSGRSVTKPSQFNPVVEPSPSSGTKRKRTQQPKFPDSIWCVKCLRGHSPPSNQIVLCDGCDAAYHQWCHDPLIEKEVAENIHESWFCGNCLHAKETNGLSIDQRVAGGNLTNEEKYDYLTLLPKPTLVSLLVHGTTMHPDLPFFAPNTRELLQTLPKSHVPRPINNPSLPTPPSSQSWKQQQQQQLQQAENPKNPMNAQSAPPTQQMHPGSQTSPVHQEHMFQHDPYPEYSNEAGDPPATYPRPGRGPIKPQATTHPEDIPWMVQDNYEVFSHLVNDGTGRMVPMQQRPEGWPAQNGSPMQPHPHHHPPPHPPQQHPDYRQQMYSAPPPHAHIHPPMHYNPHMPQHPPPHPAQHYHPQDMQPRPPQWNPGYGMPSAEQMQQHQQPQHHPQQQQQGGAMAYGSSQPMQ